MNVYEIHGSVQTYIDGGQYSSRPVWFVLPEYQPDNTRMSADGGKTWVLLDRYYIPHAENALVIAKHMLGDTGGQRGKLRIEAIVTARKVEDWPGGERLSADLGGPLKGESETERER